MNGKTNGGGSSNGQTAGGRTNSPTNGGMRSDVKRSSVRTLIHGAARIAIRFRSRSALARISGGRIAQTKAGSVPPKTVREWINEEIVWIKRIRRGERTNREFRGVVMTPGRPTGGEGAKQDDRASQARIVPILIAKVGRGLRIDAATQGEMGKNVRCADRLLIRGPESGEPQARRSERNPPSRDMIAQAGRAASG